MKEHNELRYENDIDESVYDQSRNELTEEIKTDLRNAVIRNHEKKKIKAEAAQKELDNYFGEKESMDYYEQRIKDIEEQLKDAGDMKDSLTQGLETFKVNYDALKKKHEFVREERIKELQDLVKDYDLEDKHMDMLIEREEGRAQELAEKEYEARIRDTQDRFARQEERGKYKNIADYDYNENKNYNDRLKEEIDNLYSNVYDDRKAEIFNLSMYNKLGKDDPFDPDLLEYSDIDDAAQVYDRIFGRLEKFYTEHPDYKTPDLLSDTYDDNGKDKVPIRTYIKNMLNEKGGKYTEYADNPLYVEKLAKAYVVYNMAMVKRVVIEPRYLDGYGNILHDTEEGYDKLHIRTNADRFTPYNSIADRKDNYTRLTKQEMEYEKVWDDEYYNLKKDGKLRNLDTEDAKKLVTDTAKARYDAEEKKKEEARIRAQKEREENSKKLEDAVNSFIESAKKKEQEQEIKENKQPEENNIINENIINENDININKINDDNKNQINDNIKKEDDKKNNINIIDDEDDLEDNIKKDDSDNENLEDEKSVYTAVQDDFSDIDDDEIQNDAPQANNNAQPKEKFKIIPASAEDLNRIIERFNGPIPIEAVRAYSSNLNGISSGFPQFSDNINKICDDSNILLASVMATPHVTKKMPSIMDDVNLYDSQQDKMTIAGDIYKYEQFMSGALINLMGKAQKSKGDALSAYFDENKDKYENIEDDINKALTKNALKKEFEKNYTDINQINYDLFKMIKKNSDFMLSADFMKYADAIPEYSTYFESSFTSFPSNSFNTGEMVDGKPVFKPNDEKYVELMKKYPFIDQLKENQNFYLDKYIPYLKKREEGTLTKAEQQQFRKDYKLHNDKMRQYFEKIREIDINDPEISQLEAFSSQKQTMLVDNWQGKRFGDVIMETAKSDDHFLDRGWPAEDLVFLRTINDNIKKLEELCGENSNETPETQEVVRGILNEFSNVHDRYYESYVVSPEIRDDILASLKTPIEKCAEFFDARDTRPNKDVNPLLRTYDDVVARKVTAADFGMEGGKDYKPGVNEDGFSIEAMKKNVDMMVKDLNAVEITFFGSDQFLNMKNSLLKLQKDLNEYSKENDITEQRRMEIMKEIRNAVEDTSDRTNYYLIKKETDFRKSGTRREKDSKQGVEQHRIKMAINLYDKLGYMINSLDEILMTKEERFLRDEMPKIREKNQLRLEAEIEKLDKKLGEIKILPNTPENKKNKEDYLETISRILVYQKESMDGFYKMKNGETLEQYKERIENVGNENYTRKQIRDIALNNKTMLTILKNAQNVYENGGLNNEKANINNANNANEKKNQLTATLVRNAYKKEIQRIHLKTSNDQKVTTAKEGREKNSRDFKEKLVSQKAKKLREENKKKMERVK